MGFRTSYCSFALSIVSMDGGLGPPIVDVPFPCVSMDGVEDLLLFMCLFYVFLGMEA